ncbi:surface-adhesin E family protein [Brevundimonas sp. R86498]|uniref:surface-adhesin E family protein n=1 Tax=Brevundimonas sp. R86498 TaxID=3093845 RepID=UPI0037C593D4
MNSGSILAGWVIALASLAMAGPGLAQDAVPQEEILIPPAMATSSQAEGPQWRVFSRGATSTFLIDPSTVRRDGDEIHVSVARVPLNSAPGDYSHVVDDFAVRCNADESRLTASAEAYEDGELTEGIPVDEPWGDIRAGSFDQGVQQVGCGEATPVGDPFASIRAYIDAGRP